MFFNPRLIIEEADVKFCVTSETKISLHECRTCRYINDVITKYAAEAADGETECSEIIFSLGMPEHIISRVKLYREYGCNEEEYAISIGEKIFVWAKNECGLMFAASTIAQLMRGGELTGMLIYDYPVCSVRGYRVYLPGSGTMDNFRDVIDLLAYYKYNSVIIEIGGAMEYKKHPEINEAWVEFCADMHEYSGKTHVIQEQTYPWAKNSIHCDNGDGKFLTQEQCRELRDYCIGRGLKVIPEVPCLSHSDYLLLRRPDLREQELDNHADTYCPSNPASYELLFEIMDEVIDVFEPECINIGHDELYTVGVCSRCKGKEPAELYAGDIIKIHDYLAAKGIKTVMWGEKLIDARFDSGAPCGGAETLRTDPVTGETKVYIPALYKCAQLLPRDILMLHWYWAFDCSYDKIYHENGYEAVFGNLSVYGIKRWKERLDWGMKGGFISNWGSNAEEPMQRNMITFNLVYSAYAFWSEDYTGDEESKDYFRDLTLDELYTRKHAGMKDKIEVVHTTDCYIPFRHFYDGVFIEDDIYILGSYVIEYSDGTSAELEVKYGTNILVNEIEKTSQPYEINGSAIPVEYDGKQYFKCAYENPHPEKNPAGFRFKPVKECNVFVKSVRFVSE